MAPDTLRRNTPLPLRASTRIESAAILAFVCLLLGASPSCAQAPARDSANGFSRLPKALRAALARAACRAPSPPAGLPDSGAVVPLVAYRAAVRRAGVRDWAVVCERGAVREALVFAAPLAAGSRPALRFPLPWDPRDAGCEGWLGVADAAWVEAALRTAAPAAARRVRRPVHAGLIDGVCEGGGSAIHYWDGRRWLTVPAVTHDSARGAI